MASETNVREIIKRLKNSPADGKSPRVMLELHVDQTTKYRMEAIVEPLALGGAGSQQMTSQLPAGSKVLFAGILLETAVTLTTATKLGVGTAATPNAFYLSGTTMTAGTTDVQPAPDTSGRVAAQTPVKLATTDNSGAAAGSGTGTVKVVVIYEYVQAIAA